MTGRTIGPSARGDTPASLWFLPRFLLIALISGSTLGMSRIMLALLAVSLGLTPAELGYVSGAEGITIAAMTLPAGVIVARYEARTVYTIASIMAGLCYALLPHSVNWVQLAFFISLCSICSSFRIVAMAGAFMELLPRLGADKAGWFRAALLTGLVLIGPVGGTALVAAIGNVQAYYVVSGLFFFMGLAGPSVLPRFAKLHPRPSLLRESLELIDILKGKVVARICAVEVAGAMILAYFTVFIVLIAVRTLGWNTRDAAWLIVAEGATSVVTMVVGGQLLARSPAGRIYPISALFIVAGLVTLSRSSEFFGLALGAASMAIGLGSVHVINMRGLSGEAGNKSKIASLQTMAQTLGLALGAFAGGVAAQLVGMQGVFLWIAVAVGSAAMLYFGGRPVLKQVASALA